MARVMRLIWRLDYPVSYGFLDKLGTVRRVVVETVPNFWTNVIDGNILHSYVADYQNIKSGIAREMSVEAQSLNGQLSWRSGTDLARILQTEDFRNIDRIVRELIRIIDIREMKRVGVRFLGMGNFADGKGKAFQKFSNLIANAVISGVEDAVSGNNEDLAIVFTGKTKDGISYRIQCGPTSENDFVTFFQRPGDEKELEVLRQSDFSFDIDLFEFNTSFIEHNLFRWATTKLEKAVEVVAVFEKLAS
jgi:hypothetical protein